MSRGFLALLTLALLGCGEADTRPGGTTMALPETIGSWVRQEDPVTYDRETIFDYINGAGEVYRSYDFSQVVVHRYEDPGGRVVSVEIFDMGNPRDAFGVFSYAREEEERGIGAGFELKGSILCFWQDRFYVCVAAEGVTGDPGAVLEEVARGISNALPAGGEPPPLVRALPPEGLVPHSDRYFHLHQTLNYNYYLARENVLHLSPETEAVLARYAPGSAYLILVRYPTEEEAVQALASLRAVVAPGLEGGDVYRRESGAYAAWGRVGARTAVVLDAPTEVEAQALRQAALDGLSRMGG